jgi:Cof subfamily protein (haloacid dehalogenase superfamily)
MEKKVIFFDVDGTLIDCAQGMKSVLDSTKEAIKKLRENGHLAVLATGRPKSFLDDEITKLDFDAYITSNGAYIEVNHKIIYNKTIDKKIIEEVISMSKNEGMDYVFEGHELSYSSNLNTANIKKLIRNFSIPTKYLTDSWNIKDISSNKMVLIFDNDIQKELSIELLKDKFNFMRHPGQISYDVYFKDCTKADGIKVLLNYLNISIEDTFAFGDGINDIEMFQTVRYGIAMENANEKLKYVSYLVTNDVLSHGIYNALAKFQLI